jgi:hypothetical protein
VLPAELLRELPAELLAGVRRVEVGDVHLHKCKY